MSPAVVISGSRSAESIDRLTRTGGLQACLAVDHRPSNAECVLVLEVKDVLDERVWDVVRKRTTEIMNQWYMIDGEDLSTWHGYSLGRAVTGAQFNNRMGQLYRNVLLFAGLAARGYRRFLVGQGTGIEPGVWKYLAEIHGFACDVLPYDETIEKSIRTSSQAPGRILLTAGKRFLAKIYGVVGRLLLDRWPIAQHTRSPKGAILFAVERFQHRMPWVFDDLARSTALPVVKAQHVLSPGRAHRVRLSAIRAARNLQRQRWALLSARHDRDGLYLWERIDLWPLLSPWIESQFIEHGARAAGDIAIAEAVVAEARPRAIVVEAQAGTEDTRWALVGRRAGVPVIAHQNEVWVQGSHDGYASPMADYILMTSPLGRPWFLERGFQPERLLPVEDPRIRRGSEGRRRRRIEQDIAVSDKPKILFAGSRYSPSSSEWPPLHTRQALIDMLELARQRSDMDFWIKFHPNMNLADGRGAVEDFSRLVLESGLENVYLVPKNENVMRLLPKVDVVVVVLSDVAWEAVMLGKPVIVCPPELSVHKYATWAREPLHVCERLDALGSHIDHVVARLGRNTVSVEAAIDLLSYRYFTEGSAADAIRGIVQHDSPSLGASPFVQEFRTREEDLRTQCLH